MRLTVLSMCIGSTSARLAPIFILSLWIPRTSSFFKFKGKNLQKKNFLKTPFALLLFCVVDVCICMYVHASHADVLTCWLTCSCSCFSFFGTAHHLKMRKWNHCCEWHVSFCNTSKQPGYWSKIISYCDSTHRGVLFLGSKQKNNVSKWGKSIRGHYCKLILSLYCIMEVTNLTILYIIRMYMYE